MAADNKKIVVAEFSDRELFTPVYHSFLHSKRLNGKEKLLYIVLKSFLNVGSREGEVYPTIETICDMVDMSKPTVISILKSLKKKGVLEIEQRGLNKPNLYKLYDYKALWEDNKNEEDSELEKQRKEQEAIDFLKSRGYQFVSKEKGLESVAPTKVTAEPSTTNNNIDMDKDSTKRAKSQELERYTLDQIKQIFDYDILVHDYPNRQQDIDAVMDVLHTAINTTKPTIRISGEDMPAMAVSSKLMKLDKDAIMYALDKFAECTGRIKNTTAYLLTILYSAKEQYHFDISNRVSHDMAVR